ncbi:MAG: replication initiator protein A [Fusobacteriaceae bacterium]
MKTIEVLKIEEEKIEKENEIDFFNISSVGSLVEDLKKIEIKLEDVPDIEFKEVIIKETGNFLNLKDNVINIPIEMLIFPFFTPQKQNKRVNFQYTFEDMGVSMMCTLIAKSSTDKVFQPSIFEEKIYTYLISMYEAQKDGEDSDEYIDFEISDFIVNFLGNKMNRTYYTKVEQALKNLKNTEYQFMVSNHTKLGKYKFEDEEFKLLTYQKLKVGKKIYYRVTLNKNIRKKIKEKRYVKYNSKTLVEIMNLDPIAARIYKYISKMRYEQNMNTINIRTLAAIIPLKTEQVTERVSKEGKIKTYILCRMKQVLSRIQKAFDVLKELGYIEFYSNEYDKIQNTYHLTYKFNYEKDGTCHISSFIENNKKNKTKVETIKNETIKIKKEIPVVKTKPINSEKTNNSKINFSEKVLDKIIKAKRNIYVSKSWDKRVENKINKIFSQHGEDFTIKLLNELYKSLANPIKTTLVQYINGLLKNLISFEEKPKKENLTLFGNFNPNLEKNNLSKLTKTGIKRAGKTFSKPIDSSVTSLKEMIEEKTLKTFSLYEKMDDYEKLKLEKQAIKLCCEETGMTEKILITMREKLKPAYINAIKIYIEKVLNLNIT